ncbi:helicase, partial [Enterococcus cecorum]|nr:helicase [Enterococcus cecorum]
MLDRSKLKKSKGEFTNKSIDEALSGTKIYGKIVQTYQEKANGEQAILYAHSVEYSKYFAEAFNNAGIKAVHADSNTPQGERDAIMEGFKNKEFQILCNVDLISEGFNVPDCSTVILLRPTQSLTVFVQQSMRGMRYVPNKKATIIDHVGNYLKHGLPDTERLWTLMGKEQVQPKLSICPNCHSIFENWNQEKSEFATTYTCPCCGHSFTEYK